MSALVICKELKKKKSAVIAHIYIHMYDIKYLYSDQVLLDSTQLIDRLKV